MKTRDVLLSAVPLLTAWAHTLGDDWPQFRGPGGQGHADASGLPVTWSETENVTWKTAIPGRGWSSPVLQGQQIWVTTAIESGVSEDEKKERLVGNTNSQPLLVSGPVSLRAVCVERDSGRLRHNVEVLTERRPDPIHELNSFASPTPVIEGERLYCHFGSNGTACVDTSTGHVLWRTKRQRVRHENGPGGSPILWRDFLIFHCDGSDKQYIVALDKRTGKVAWKTDRSGELRENPQLKKAYGTPIVADVDGRPRLLSPAADWLYAYDPATGKELWKLNYDVLGFSVVPRPVLGFGLAYICTCFSRSELLAVRYADGGEGRGPHIAWRYARQVPKISSPLLVGDTIYFVSDGGILTALDARSGTLRWRERLGGNFCSSPLFADGRIYIGNREGVTSVVRPGEKFDRVAQNELDGQIMASPAAVNGALFLRTDKALYRIERDD